MNAEKTKRMMEDSKSQKSEDDLAKQSKSKISGFQKDDTRYQYPYVEMEYVLSNPSEYIIPQCLPACKSLWAKNIETFMVSNNDDKDLYVLLANVSPQNMEKIREMTKSDPRFVFDEYRDTIGIAVKGMTEASMDELVSLTDEFDIQDTTRFLSARTFLEKYKTTNGKMVIENDGTIRRKQNPALANTTLREALEKTGKSHLYVAEEGRIYESPTFLKWHRRYQQSLQENMQDQISEITPIKDNIDGRIAHLRDTFLSAEREYVAEVLKDESMRNLIGDINSQPTDVLFTTAQRLIDQVDSGQVSDDRIKHIEKQLIVLLASIQDRVLTKNLVLIPSESHSKSR